MYNYEKNREQVVNDLDRVIKLIHMKADEIPEEIAKILDASDKAAAKAKEVFGL